MKEALKNLKEVGSLAMSHIHVSALDTPFDRSQNVRDADTGYRDRNELARKIVQAGGVTNPLQVGVVDVKDFKALKALSSEEQIAAMFGEAGFRRKDTVGKLVNGELDNLFPGASEAIDGYVPVIINFRKSYADVIIARTDHSATKGLDMVDLGWQYRQLKLGIEGSSDEENIYEMKELFYESASSQTQAKLNTKLAALDIQDLDATEHLRQEKEILADYWKGRRQKLHRVFCSTNPVLLKRFVTNYKLELAGKDYIAYKPKCYTMPVEELDAWEVKYLADKKEHGNVVAQKMWNKKKVEEQRTVFGSDLFITTMLGIVLQDGASQTLWQDGLKDVIKAASAKYEENPDEFRAYLGL